MGTPKLTRTHPPGTKNYMEIHPVVVEKFLSGPKWWTCHFSVTKNVQIWYNQGFVIFIFSPLDMYHDEAWRTFTS